MIKQQSDSAKILLEIENQLEKENIHFLREEEVNSTQAEFLRDYFLQKVSPRLVTVILKEEEQDFTDEQGFSRDKNEMTPTENIVKGEKLYAVIEMPKEVDRFVVLPPEGEKQNLMMLDDMIRYHFHLIFSMFNYNSIEGHMIKITRDAELDIEEDVGKSYGEDY